MAKSAEKKKTKLSVMVIARDEEQNIKDCLETVKWADEIVVLIDDRTKDKTATIAKKYTKKVFFRKLESFGLQYQAALEKTTGDWVLKLDADERVTPQLKEEILQKIQSQKFAAYHAYFHVFFLGKSIPPKYRAGAIRLFKRDKSRFAPLLIQEHLSVKGEIGLLKNPIVHCKNLSFFELFEKFNFYTGLEAKQWFEAGGRTNPPVMIAATANSFWRQYISYHHGGYGFVLAILSGVYTLLKHLKMWEQEQKAKGKLIHSS